MQRTITAAFDSRDAAERAAEALVFRFGIDRADVYDQSSAGTLWQSLGGHHIPEQDRHLFGEAVQRGGALVSAKVPESQLEPAMDLLESHGAWDLDEREHSWRSEGWTDYSTYGGDAVLGARGNMHDTSAEPPATLLSSGGHASTGLGSSGMTGSSEADAALTPGDQGAPGTKLSRGLDDALGTNMSGARPENETSSGYTADHASASSYRSPSTGGGMGSTGSSDLDAALTPGDQGKPGTKLTRGIDEALGTNLSGAHPENETSSGYGASSSGRGTTGSSDLDAGLTPGDQGPPGTKLSRGVDDALGTNISGARPQNEGMGTRTGLSGRDEEAIPVVEENLRVGKREVTHGRVRVRSYVVETPVEEQVRLRDEHVHVERQRVDRPVTDADRVFQDRTIEASETAEEAVVSKEARVTEEVRLQKEAQERTETVRDTVRRTEVEIENDNPQSGPLPPGGTSGTGPRRGI
jgi:uncharacterized protein (TIGR02271 family)